MALSTDALALSVNLEMQNHERRGSSTATGDGASTAFLVAPVGSYILDNTTWGAYINDVEETDITMNFDTGLCEFDTAPADEDAVSFTFDFQPYHPAVVDAAIDAGVNSLFPHFYSEKTEAFAPEDFVDNELPITLCEAVISFMTNSGTSWVRVPRRNYEVYNDNGAPMLRFFGAVPTVDQMRVHFIARPDLTELPDRAAFPVISYACYYLLLQKTAARVRGDVAIQTQGVGTLSPRQMTDAANSFYLRFQMQLQTVRMRPWSAF